MRLQNAIGPLDFDLDNSREQILPSPLDPQTPLPQHSLLASQRITPDLTGAILFESQDETESEKTRDQKLDDQSVTAPDNTSSRQPKLDFSLWG